MASVDQFGSAPHIEVPKGEWRVIETQGSLFVQGITTNIGVAIYSPAAAIALAGHFRPHLDYCEEPPHLHLTDGASFTAMDLESYRLMPEVPDLQVWAGGGLFLSRKDVPRGRSGRENITIANAGIITFKSLVMDALHMRQRQGATLCEDWLNKRRGSVDFAVDVASGESYISRK